MTKSTTAKYDFRYLSSAEVSQIPEIDYSPSSLGRLTKEELDYFYMGHFTPGVPIGDRQPFEAGVIVVDELIQRKRRSEMDSRLVAFLLYRRGLSYVTIDRLSVIPELQRRNIGVLLLSSLHSQVQQWANATQKKRLLRSYVPVHYDFVPAAHLLGKCRFLSKEAPCYADAMPYCYFHKTLEPEKPDAF